MIPILYESTEVSFISNGIGRLHDCISCVVTEERNGIYECDFEYPVDGARFGDIQIGRIICVEHDDTTDVQPFDIVSYSKPLNGVVTFHCQHISYRLGKTVVSGTNINSLSAAMTLLGQGQPTSQFRFEADFTSSAYMAAADGVPRSVRSMLGGVEGSILDTYGGEFEFDKFRVKLYKSLGEDRNLTIRYGVNLTDYNEEMDCSETYNAAIPYWVSSDGQVVKGSLVQSGQTTATGRVEAVPLDLSDKFQNKPTASQLNTLAKSMMTSGKTAFPVQTVSVSFIQNDDPQIAKLQVCRICDKVRLEFPRYNMSGKFKVVKTVYDVLAERYEEMELGTLSTTLSEALGITNGLGESGGVMPSDGVIFEDYAFTFSYTAGTIGTRGYEGTANGSKSGYYPISATMIQGNTYYNDFDAKVAVGGTVTLIAYRTTTQARTNDTATIRVAYLKI